MLKKLKKLWIDGINSMNNGWINMERNDLFCIIIYDNYYYIYFIEKFL